MTRLVLLSDTHSQHGHITVPPGDILIHAGDCTTRGGLEELTAFNEWLGTLPHPHKIMIAGNHDFCFERMPSRALPLLTNATYLQDSGITINGINFYGSPWQPWFYSWAFNLDRGSALEAVWQKIPLSTDVLITHGPPHGILDITVSEKQVGCKDLRHRITELPQLKLHVFGHIHEAYGKSLRQGIRYVNASICTLRYEPINAPIVIDL